jgi:hypothetical protein
MNTFGIDYQPSVTFIALREEGREVPQIASVGDGVRALIPNVVSNDGRWGSRADGADSCAAPGAEAWQQRPGAALFWKGLFARLETYLGRLAPVRRNGYRLCVALQGAQCLADAHAVADLGRAAGFDEMLFISAAHALFCRWLSAAPLADHERPRSVVVVSSGETTTQVCGLQLDWSQKGPPAVLAVAPPSSIDDSGFAVWNQRLLELLRGRLKEEPPPGFERVLRDSALRYAMRLSRVGAETPMEWQECWEERLFMPLALSYADCAKWPEAVAFARQLPDAVDAASNILGNRSADLLLVGGLGASWPFARHIASRLGAVWCSGAVAEDVASGAAWWGLLCNHPSGILLDGAPAPERPAVAPGAALPISSPGPAVLPPWERDGHAG